jgi:hypothetical protein
MFKELEGQVESEKAKHIINNLNPTPIVGVKQVQASTITTKKSSSVEDELSKWLN